MRRKLGLFRHICRMDNSRKIKKRDDVNDGGSRKKRKTVQGVDRRHRRLVPD